MRVADKLQKEEIMETAKKVGIPTLGLMLVAGWALGVDPIIEKTLLGFLAALIGFPILGAGWNGLKGLAK